MPLQTFTENPSYVYALAPEYRTDVNEFENAEEERINRWTTPKRRWDLEFRMLTKTRMETIRDFFIARKGRFEAFYWTCKIDGVQYIVRFDDDDLDIRQVWNRKYEVRCRFVTCNE